MIYTYMYYITYIQALLQLRESLQLKFEVVHSDGGVPFVFRLPNGEKLMHKFGVFCSCKVWRLFGCTFDLTVAV